MTINELSLNGGYATYAHQHGALTVELPEPLDPDAIAHLSVVARGVPDPRFAYLDSTINVAAASLADSGLALLGTEASLFDSRYVALMPGTRWLPSAGANVDGGRRSVDLFNVDLEVRVPHGWLVAGPGRRRQVRESPQMSYFRFNPSQKLPEVGLLASRFESRKMAVGDIEIEVLFHGKHGRNFELHADQGPVDGPGAALGLRFFADDMFLDHAESLGMPYVYDALTFVEVPGVLRGYGGGWRMESVLALPGLVLLRENGFPTASFDFGYWFEGRSQLGLATKWNLHLLPYFGADFTGGNPFRSVPKTFLPFLTGITGDGAIPTEFLLNEIAIRILARTDPHVAGYFSAHLVHAEFATSAWPGMALVNRLLGNTAAIHEASVLREIDRDSVWNLASTVPLARLDPNRAPRDALGVLILKSRATARTIIDLLGQQRTAQLLSEIQRTFDEVRYTVADILHVASTAAPALDSIVHDYLYESSMPGYVTSQPEMFRISDDARGVPRYQTRIHVRNDESVPGFVRLFYVGRVPTFHYGSGEMIRIDGHTSSELGLVTEAPPQDLILQVFLARNRTDLRFKLPTLDVPALDEEGFHGVRPSRWQPRSQAGIVIDDLDPGFRVVDGTAFRSFGERATSCRQLKGERATLPTFSAASRSEGVWYRQNVSLSWGKYRNTVARTSPGNGNSRVVFQGELPEPGSWRLHYHIPLDLPGPPIRSGFGATYRTNPSGLKLGAYDMRLIADGETLVEFDASQADTGWNHIGDFDLPSGSTCVVLSNRTSGGVVVADAVRWNLLGPSQNDEASVPQPSATQKRQFLPVVR